MNNAFVGGEHTVGHAAIKDASLDYNYLVSHVSATGINSS
jgi:hypothetical protein